VRARAEQLPIRDSSCDLAWMSQVLHHLPDRPACARELRRVLRPGGHLLIRGAFGDHVDGFPGFFRFWPRTREVVEQMPTTVDATAIFAAAGFELREHRRITQQTCASLRECAERSRGRADTSLTLISDEEFYAGLAALEEAAALETTPTPVQEIIELLIFQST
jgi:ubiquinone/menaquinone biosynthesis C-methylase UbiE